MKEWIKVKTISDLPKDEQFIAIWKGVICLCEYDDDENNFKISFFPAQYDVMTVSREREKKFSYYMKLTYPETP